MMISPDDLRACWLYVRDADGWTPHLNAAAKRWGIETPSHWAAWLAQCGHESGDGTRLEEDLNYTTAMRVLAVFGWHACRTEEARQALRQMPKGGAWPAVALAEAAELLRDPRGLGNRVYASREGNGDEASGDGYAMRGGGLIQVTFRNAWAAYGKAVGLSAETAAASARLRAGAADSAGWYFKTRGLAPLAEAGDFDRIACLTAGKRDAAVVEGIADRRARWQRCCVALGV
jgi:putative chitinase